MSLRLEMLNAARLAPKVLGESTGLVRRFFLDQQHPDGGFKNRANRSDLYYLQFGLAGLAAVSELDPTGEIKTRPREDFVDRVTRYLTAFGDGADLDFVHLCCLARSWAALQGLVPNSVSLPALKPILGRLELHRTPDAGYNPQRGSVSGTAYGAFLALGAYQDLAACIPRPGGLASSLAALQTGDGAYTNSREPQTPTVSSFADHFSEPGPEPNGRSRFAGTTNATAAAVVVLDQLGAPVHDREREWLLARLHPGGGFLASPESPVPDLLSTATALHTLATLGIRKDTISERCLDFIDSLWTNVGGFYGHWGDQAVDCEYTFYGLLALGSLVGRPIDEE
ncbi:MAG TPA: prenyltransferase/squalene oxidase repeat-containing protein [Verrucomicrobiae bacterium]